MAGVTSINITLFILCAAGVGASYYSIFVEKALEQNEKYQAMCDINDQLNCSKVFGSKYAKGFGVVGKYLGEKHILNQPNGVYGVAFYGLLALLSLINVSFLVNIQLLLAFLSNGLSVYLGYLLLYVIKSICVVCVGTYVINFLILIFTIVKLRRISKKLSKKAQKAENKQKKAAKKNK
ncbi:vitamin K epoxide reductase complex subunit 1-like protein 1 [Frankliniella occidentalis]|uniref:vitamin-K-epoxide reductase (warfarin-sensitive) n=1 Tax=Frankliniella occidentalis TaxID=133901 RepID=A0A6J1SPF7_FRAOC|nr:vitamin K epoxide reductase complex subunit 1-like protein 1 [Frankliniella occidentalis]